MPRMIRLEHPGTLAHVMARGIDGVDIFKDTFDRTDFLNRLSRGIAATGYRCLCWCLIPNHFHMLIRSNDLPMSRLMRPLNSGYASAFNRKYQRTGYLYQDRFKSVLCQDQQYARRVIRYIHLNPIRAGLVNTIEELARWPWCGHGYILNVRGALGAGFQCRNEVLRRFGDTARDGMQKYLNYLSEAIDENQPELSGLLDDSEMVELEGASKGWPAVVGDPDFARSAMDAHAVSQWRKHRKADYASVLMHFADSTCQKFSIEKDQLFQKGRNNGISTAREYFCYRAHYVEKIPYSVVARFLEITLSPAMRLAERGKKRFSREDVAAC